MYHSNNYVSHYIPPFLGFAETTLMPLQASTILLQADQRRAGLNPPLPLISHDQVQSGKLATLLTEEDYNLSTMVNLKFHFYYYALKEKLPICYFQYFSMFSLRLESTLFSSDFHLQFSPAFSYGFLCTFFHILHEIL